MWYYKKKEFMGMEVRGPVTPSAATCPEKSPGKGICLPIKKPWLYLLLSEAPWRRPKANIGDVNAEPTA